MSSWQACAGKDSRWELQVVAPTKPLRAIAPELTVAAL
jgi:hypothetical protein